MSAVAKWILTIFAHNIVAILWWLGDVVWDWTVAPGRGKAVRDINLRAWTLACQRLDSYEPKTKRQRVWKENKMNGLRETGDLMAFSPYVTLPERAERMVNGGGVHQL